MSIEELINKKLEEAQQTIMQLQEEADRVKQLKKLQKRQLMTLIISAKKKLYKEENVSKENKKKLLCP